MYFKQKINSILKATFSSVTKKSLLAGCVVAVTGGIIAANLPQTISFSYAGDNCIRQLSFLPNNFRNQDSHAYNLEVTDTLKIASYPVVGTNICANPIDLPQEGQITARVAFIGMGFLGKSFNIDVPAVPNVSTGHLSKPLPSAKPVVLPLSTTDKVFSYTLSAKDRQVDCSPANKAVSCDISKLELEQGESHQLTIGRKFKDTVEVVVKKEVEILPAVKITESSINPDQVIYDKPTEFTFLADKPLDKAEVKLYKVDEQGEHSQPAKVDIDNRQLTVRLAEELHREADFKIILTGIESVDGSTLATDYETQFKVSGGPRVSHASVGRSGVDPSANIVLQLDQPIKSDQDISHLIKLTGVQAVISSKDDKIYLQLANAGRCVDFSVEITKGLLSQHEISSDHAWKLDSRTRCHTVETIGYSQQGRPINAYYFGNGDQTILFTGAIHGNELSSKYIMDSWIDSLESNSGQIPANKQIVVIPTVSPDSVAVASRYNSRGINLNRNFPTGNWTSDITVSGGRVEPGAGGTTALSESESSTLARITRQLSPRLVVTYHSLGSLVNGNDVGIANTLGPSYARTAGYRYIPNSATNDTFGIEMTGTYEDWLAEIGMPAILIELNTNTGNHFAQNREAMWSMVKN